MSVTVYYWILAAVAGLLTAGSALFSAFETAIFSLQPHELERLRRENAWYAQAFNHLLHNSRRLLGVLVLCNVTLNVPLVLIGLYFLHHEVGTFFPLWASALLLFGLLVLVCDLLPKVAALLYPHRLVGPAVRVLTPLMGTLERPLAWMQRVSDRFAELVVPMTAGHLHPLNQTEMETLLEFGEENGALHPVECAIIQEVIRLGDKTVRDCMTPRVDALCFPDDLTNSELALRLRTARFRRVPVYGETPDDVLGILDVRAFLESEKGEHYTAMLAPPSFVPETMRAVDLLRSFLRRPQSLAIVVDEHGGTEGVVTRADLVEEVLSDALPGGEKELYLETLGVGRLLASGSARIEEVEEALGVEIASEGIDTIGGLTFNVVGDLPRLGTVLSLDQVRITVRRTSRKRVEEVLVEALVNRGGQED
ncbi:MAG: hemolysin family protein [Verrucomicrobiota bacterium]